MKLKKNIIFDLGGVLFKQNEDKAKPLEPILDGIALFNDCVHHAQEEGNDLYVCSNMSEHHLQMLQSVHPHIFKNFKGMVNATNAQAKKPNPDIFNYLLRSYNLIAEHSFFIDDQIHNVDAARLLGMHAIHMTDYKKVREALRKHNLI